MKIVTIYSTPTCVYCKLAKDFFKQNNVEFVEKDVLADKVAREEMMKLTGQLAVPVINVDGKVMIGFDKGHLKELLGVA